MSEEFWRVRITLKITLMLYLIAVILIIGWILGFFVFSGGYLVHILLVLAIVAILLRLIRGDRLL
jgi:uncharacterized membrane protein